MRSSAPIFGSAFIAAVLFGCSPAMEYSSVVPYQDTGGAYLPLPAPLEGETVEQGHLCDARAITQAVMHKFPGSDPAMVEQEVQNLLYTFGCGAASSEPAPLSSATPPSTSTSPDEISIERSGGDYVVPVRINQAITLPFILDTGAAELVIPVDVALTLMRAGALVQSDFIGKSRYTMANGSETVQERVVIHEVQVGNHRATDVTASVSSAAGSPLLGESFLSKFGTVTIDYNRLVLILSH
jgi:clan AA aspartic protease (TIGR02281 family)